MKMHIRVFLPAGLVLAALVTLACGGHRTAAHERAAKEPGTGALATGLPEAVELAVATLAAQPLTTRATGSLEPVRRVLPGTKILGRIDRVMVREGDHVEKGALLARFESRDLEAAVNQAEAAGRMAEAQLENALAQLGRMHELHGRGSVTDKNLEDATAAHRVAEAGLDQARADVAAARVTLSYAEVRSPLTGWVVARNVEAGDMATPGTPLFALEDLARVKAVVQVPEADIVGLEEGAEARLEVFGRTIEAVVDRIVPAGDPASRTFSVHLVVDNDDGEMKSGMYARVSFVRGEREVLSVPVASLVKRGQLEGLFVAGEHGRLQLRWIRTGRRLEDGARVEVISGLVEGERYVVDAVSGLKDGMAYR